MRVLISVYACEPNRGSEPGVGWNVVREIAKEHEVWAFTSTSHRPAIEAELMTNPIPNLHFVYPNPLGWTYDWSNEGKRVLWGWGIHPHYYLWQISAYFVARSLHQQIGFDLVHHVTYVKYAGPSFLAFLPVPFLWGPVGGAESAPKTFWQNFSLRGKLYEALRDLSHWFGECDPFVRLTAQRSVIAWATTEETAQRLRQMGASNVQVSSAIGLSKEEIARFTQPTRRSDTPIRFISIARLLHWKGLHLGLRAFASANLPNAEYWILGDGPERQRLGSLVQELKIERQVKFWSQLPRHETLHKLGECLALVHPSLHDSGGYVCLEAMASGCPVICLDLGGPALQVTEETGFKIPAHRPDQVVRDLAQAMVRLVNEPELRIRMGRAGRKRVSDTYSWESKGQFFAQLYEEVLNRKFSVLLTAVRR